MKIKFNSDDKLPLKKTIETPAMTKLVRAAFLGNNKYYVHVILGSFLRNIKKGE